MTGHAIRDGRPVCLEPETANCRARWDCNCESWGDFGENADGSCWHVGGRYDDAGEEVMCISVGTYDANDCNICTWLNDDLYGTGPGETWAAGLYAYDIDLPDGLIQESWEYDYYSWDYTEPRVIGALIGHLVVARWADDLGLAA